MVGLHQERPDAGDPRREGVLGGAQFHDRRGGSPPPREEAPRAYTAPDVRRRKLRSNCLLGNVIAPLFSGATGAPHFSAPVSFLMKKSSRDS